MKSVKIPLFWKFTIAIVFIVAFFGSINVYLIWNNVYQNLDSELEARGIFIAKNIASNSVEPLMYDDYLAIQKSVDDLLKSDENIKYIFISRNNRVVAHTFSNGVPVELLNANKLSDSAGYSAVLITSKEQKELIIKDIAVPILDASVGNVRLGISEINIRNKVNQTIYTLLVMVGVFLILGIFGAFVFSYIITNPVKAISNSADRIDLEQLGNNEFSRFSIRNRSLFKFGFLFKAEDEIDLLAEKFNNMLERLEKTYTELKHAETSLIQSEKLASIGTLVSGLAHEINNPVSGIQNCLKRMEKDPSNTEQNAKYIKLMKDAADVIEKVIRELLNFSRKEQLVFQKTDLYDLIEKSLILVGHRLEKERIELNKFYNSPNFYITGSLHHLEQVFVNLLLNSIDAITERRKSDQERTDYIKISIAKINNEVEIIFEDSGIGIKESDLNQIFDPFYTSKETGKGTGLGLSVSYNIIRQHNGSITVESIFKEGTKFKLILPINNTL